MRKTTKFSFLCPIGRNDHSYRHTYCSLEASVNQMFEQMPAHSEEELRRRPSAWWPPATIPISSLIWWTQWLRNCIVKRACYSARFGIGWWRNRNHIAIRFAPPPPYSAEENIERLMAVFGAGTSSRSIFCAVCAFQSFMEETICAPAANRGSLPSTNTPWPFSPLAKTFPKYIWTNIYIYTYIYIHT